MSEFDTNYSSLCCPFCGEEISNKEESYWVFDLEDEDEDFFQCQKCEKFFKAELNIYKEYNYEITKPTPEEIKKHGLIPNKNKDVMEDIPGQQLFSFFNKN